MSFPDFWRSLVQHDSSRGCVSSLTFEGLKEDPWGCSYQMGNWNGKQRDWSPGSAPQTDSSTPHTAMIAVLLSIVKPSMVEHIGATQCSPGMLIFHLCSRLKFAWTVKVKLWLEQESHFWGRYLTDEIEDEGSVGVFLPWINSAWAWGICTVLFALGTCEQSGQAQSLYWSTLLLNSVREKGGNSPELGQETTHLLTVFVLIPAFELNKLQLQADVRGFISNSSNTERAAV